jgi:hypothetical protein
MQSKDERDADAAALRRELQKLVANYTGPVRKIPTGKRTTKRKAPSSSARWEVNWSDDLDGRTWGR